MPPLAIHYLRVSPAPGRRHTVSVSFPSGRNGARASLVYRVDGKNAGVSGGLVRIQPRSTNRGRDLAFTLPDRLRRSATFVAPLLVLSNGDANGPAGYVVRLS